MWGGVGFLCGSLKKKATLAYGHAYYSHPCAVINADFIWLGAAAVLSLQALWITGAGVQVTIDPALPLAVSKVAMSGQLSFGHLE